MANVIRQFFVWLIARDAERKNVMGQFIVDYSQLIFVLICRNFMLLVLFEDVVFEVILIFWSFSI